jgi:SAM-dependent methyltransferase
VDILDVGAGPLTILGKRHAGRQLRIVAVDPLAAEYDRILGKHGVTPPLRTIPGDAEQLSTQFGRDAFDLVYAENCIDHSYSPENAILEMVKVVRKDGFAVLKHSANEAEKEGYEGLHQWNLSQENGDFIISTRTSRLNFTQKHKALCKVSCAAVDEDWILTIIQRNA